MQKTIDLLGIIERLDLNKNELAKELYPTHTHPTLALNRILKNEGVLDANQISKLSMLTGLEIGDLFTVNGFKISKAKKSEITGTRPDVLHLQHGDYKAVYYARTRVTKIYHKKTLFHETVFNKDGIALSDYLNLLINIIKKNS